MRGFNLSAWSVSHPALILFMMLALGAAGLFSYERLGRAEDPSFTIKLVIVTAIWPGATAAEMQTQVADPIEKKLQELPYFDKVQTYSKPSFTAMTVTFKDNTPPKEVPQLFYQLRKKISDIKGELPARSDRAELQRRIWRRRLHPLHDDRRRRRLRAAEEGRRRHAAASVAGARRHQGQSLRHPGREDLCRLLARQARHARRHPADAVRLARQAERRGAGRHGGDLVAAGARYASPARSTAPRRWRKRRSRATAGCSGSATSPA